MTLKRLYKQVAEAKLQADNPQFQDIIFVEFDEISILGIVAFCIKRH